jgi:hypothetical protein
LRRRSIHRPATLTWLAIVSVWALCASSTALGIGAPSLSVSPTTPSQAADWTFTFSAQPDPLATLTGYEGGIVASAGEEPATPIASPFVATGLPEGVHVFRVRAVQQDLVLGEVRGPYATATIQVDRTPPAPPTATFVPATPNGTNGWYRSLTIDWSCSDPSGAVCPDQVISVARAGATARQVATDGAGNVSAATVTPAFNFDNGAFLPAISSPSNAARVAAEPTYRWVRVTDPTSGNDRFEVWARWAGVSDQLIARAGASATSATRNARTGPLPQAVSIRWFVRFYDRAGNFRDSSARTFTIDPTPPSSAPTITGGPAGPTRETTPTFSWSGTEPSFSWDVTRAGDADPAQAGKGAAKQVTLNALTDGEYTFRVSQVTALGAQGPEVTQAFSVDTTPPAPPVITGRPANPTATPAAFAWSTETGAFSRWQVVDGAGAAVKGPSDTPATSVTVGALASGAYTFRVSQVDAAGNVSPPAAEAFAVQLPPGTVVATPKPRAVPLPTQNAGRLTPRAGRRVATIRPIFRWKKGPAGTTLYNVQVFRVVKKRAGRAATIKKIHSAFPRATRYRSPKKLAAGQCYVWRVWPYTGSSFTAQPLGISNFCVVSSKVLRRNAARVKARQKARAQTAAARVG